MAPDRERNSGEQAVHDLLLELIRRDPYPSTTMMRIAEAQLTNEERPAYVAMLLEKVCRDQFPSVDLLRHLAKLSR